MSNTLTVGKKKDKLKSLKITKDYVISNSIQLTKNLYILEDVYQDYMNATFQKLSVGYMWIDVDDLQFKTIPTKNGLASTGDIKGRVTNFKTRGKKVIIDIIIDEHFTASTQTLPNGEEHGNFDQYLNAEIANDYKELGISVLDNRSTLEDVQIPRTLLLKFPELKRITLSRVLGKRITKLFISSPEHEKCLDLLKNNTLPYFLLDCVMRFGKSFIYYEYIKRNFFTENKFGIHIVMCHDTKTFDGWKRKGELYYNDCVTVTELKNKKDFDFTKTYDKNQVVLISPQLLVSKSNLDITDESVKSEKNIAILSKFGIIADTVFVDEVHQYFTLKWKAFYESIITDSGQIILASGTAANLKITHYDLFDETNTWTDTLDDLTTRLNKEHKIDVKVILKRINLLNVFEDIKINIGNLQDVNERGTLTNPRQADSFLKAFFLGTDNNRNQFSPILSSTNEHFVMLLDRVEFAYYVKEFILKNCNDIVPILVAGNNSKRDAKLERDVKKQISNAIAAGKRTITLTCGSMIQGVSIREWKEMINLSSITTYQVFYQLLGRGFEFDDILDRDKSFQVVMWDYNPSRTLKVAGQFVQSLAQTSKEKNISESLKKFFDIHRIEDYFTDTNGFPTVNEADIRREIIEEIDKRTLTNGCKSRLVTNSRSNIVMNMDTDLADICYNTVGGKLDKTYRKNLESYKGKLKKQTSNYSVSTQEKSGNVPTVSQKSLKDKILDGLSVYTERIDVVAEVMFKQNVIESKNIYKLLEQNQNDIFISGFRFPNKTVSKKFAEYLMKNGDLLKINNKLSELNRIPNLYDLLDLNKSEIISKFGRFEDIWKYGGSDNQIPFEFALTVIKEKYSKLKFSNTSYIVDETAKNGSFLLASMFYLYKNSKRIFKRELTIAEIINLHGYEEENTFFSLILSTMGFKKIQKNMEFDVKLGNPPYKDGLHIKLFNASHDGLKRGGKVIFIHRETPVISKTSRPDSKTKKYRDTMLNNTSEITFFDGNKVFANADFFTPLIISEYTKDGIKSDIKINSNHVEYPFSYNVSQFEDIYIHTNPEIVKKIRNKIETIMLRNNMTNLNLMSSKNVNYSSYWVNIKQIGGHPMKNEKINKDFYCLVSPKFENDYENQIVTDLNKCKTPAGRGGGISCNSYEESLNLFNYLKTKFVRFVFSITKIDQNIWDGEMLSVIPYLDFTKEWTDDSLFEYFEFDDEMKNYVNDYIEPIYAYESK